MTIHYRTTRRGPATLAALALVLAACGGGSPTTSAGNSGEASQSAVPEPNELLVLEWGGYEEPDFWVDFADAHPDTDVQFELGASDADVLSLMQGGS
jgi:ABC-type glycerol-3-phosphate transport system substrate-binding protein